MIRSKFQLSFWVGNPIILFSKMEDSASRRCLYHTVDDFQPLVKPTQCWRKKIKCDIHQVSAIIDLFPEIFWNKKNLQLLQDAIASRICCTPTYHTSFRSHDRREGVVCSLDFVYINELPFDLCTVTTREGSSPSDCCTILTNSSKSVPSGLPWWKVKTSTLNTFIFERSFAHKASSSTTFNNDVSCIQTSRGLQGSCNFHPHFYAWMSLTLWSWFCTLELSPPAVGSPQVTTCPSAKIAANALKDPWIFSTPPDLSKAQKNLCQDETKQNGDGMGVDLLGYVGIGKKSIVPFQWFRISDMSFSDFHQIPWWKVHLKSSLSCITDFLWLCDSSLSSVTPPDHPTPFFLWLPPIYAPKERLSKHTEANCQNAPNKQFFAASWLRPWRSCSRKISPNLEIPFASFFQKSPSHLKLQGDVIHLTNENQWLG